MNEQEFAVLVAKVGQESAVIIKEQVSTLQKEMETKLVEATKSNATKQEIEEIKIEAEKAKDSIMAILKEQGAVLATIKDKSVENTNKDRYLEIAEKHIEGIRASSMSKGKDYTFKADTLRSSVTNNGYAYEETSIGQLATRKLTVYDIFRKVQVSAGSNGVVRYSDWDAATTVRAAAAIAEGGTFPESTAKWQTYTLSLEKVGDIIPMSVEFARDATMFASELRNFLATNVAIKIDTDLVSGSGTSPNINGLKNQIPSYTAVASGITDASIYDLIVKLRESITSSYGSKYSPNVALMNIADINKMKLKKDVNNNYVLPPFFNQAGQVVDGITVVECNSFAANTMAVGDSRYGVIYEDGGIEIETGFATGDFESDMMSLKARHRLNLLIRQVDRTGWLEVTSISAALTTLAS